ncbi:MAG: hypothetical protein LBL63_00620 [Clostridiales Family XIII bacterium]|jgi:hypothetical protein|nr:hypothetical protein [Clostridiales Family XIII bacterium]
MSEGKRAEDLRERESCKLLRDEVEKKMGKPPEELFEEREKRLRDAVALKAPDRVPVVLFNGYFPFRYTGLSNAASFYDPSAYKKALIKTLLDFPADSFFAAYKPNSGRALEILGDTQYAWAGGPYDDDRGIQFREREIMEADEYDLFITDPGDYMLRYYLPRRYKALAPLASLPSPSAAFGTAGVLYSTLGYTPAVIGAFDALSKAGEEQAKFYDCNEEVSKLLGMPQFLEPGFTGLNTPPFHQIVDYLRGMHGIALDMFKRPEKLIAAMERLMEWSLARAETAPPEAFGKRRVMAGGNHFSSEEFISRKHFDTFVWPTWKRCLIGLIDRGFVPRWLMEGKNDDRMDPFLELPKGKAIIHFEKIDMARAKEMLADHICIAGNVPASLLWGGSPQEVEDYCKDLIRVCGKNGGFILTSGGSMDDAKPENLKAMIDAAEKYGRYN